VRWETEQPFDGKLCLEYFYQKLSKSVNWFSSYSHKCRGCFLGHSVGRGYCYKISFHHCRVNARLNFFSNPVMAIWNSLPKTVVTAPTIDIFKSLFMKLELPTV